MPAPESSTRSLAPASAASTWRLAWPPASEWAWPIQATAPSGLTTIADTDW